MNLKEQYEFVSMQLTVSAETVGIDLKQSGDALMCIWCHEGDEERSLPLSEYCTDQEYAEAMRLIKKYRSNIGRSMLFYLGEACVFQFGKTGYGRFWDKDVKDCRFSRARAFCDFAMSVGHAAHLCAEYTRDNKPSKAGGEARAKKYKQEAEKVTALFASMAGLAEMSADEAASYIIGKVNLSHRKIADTIRESRKKQGAKQTTRNA